MSGAGGPDYDVIVIGGGVAGASIAARLAPQRRVAVLETEDVLAYHTTGRSAAMYVPSYGAAAVQALTRASAAFFRAPPQGFADGPLLTPRPVLHVASARRLRELDDLAERTGLPRIAAAEARAQVPVLRADAVAAALLDDTAADIDTDRLFQGFLRTARAAGAQVSAGLGDVALRREEGAWVARARDAVFRAPVVVNAAGAWADEVAGRAGVRPAGLRPLRRTMVLADVEGPAPTGWPVVMDVRERFYFKPAAGGLLLTAGDETPSAPCDAAAAEFDVALAMARVQAVLACALGGVRNRWAGLRTFTEARTPVVGYAPDAPGFFWMAGLGGFGMQTAPALSGLAASLLLREPPAPGLDALAPQLAPGAGRAG